ncbi:MAG: DUF1549 domain-containing protein [Planctomycetaceae bacterium]
MNRSVFIIALCVLLGAVCPIGAGESAQIDFAHDIVPILRKRCIECHGGPEAKGGMSLNTRSTLLDAAAIVPGRANESRIVELVTSADPEEQMPPKDRGRLTDAEVDMLRRWIDAGAAWEEGFTFDEARYEPPLRPRQVGLPPAQGGRTNPIDRILDAYRVERDLPTLRPLDDAAFLRRLSLDIVGLLPNAEELHAFLADEQPDKRDQLIARTLGRDREFAVHWLTFWSDLLRNTYSGTGFIDDGRRQITEWLYGALLTNKRYDEFVRELIAPAPEAAGFIRGIKWRGNVNSSQAAEIQFAQSLGQVFLGINMKCASCHDSFIDRWTLDETYNLAAVYATGPLEVHRCDVPSGRSAKPVWLFPELGAIDAEADQPERLRQLAALMTHPENGRLTRTIVNRLWERMLGRGIVHPVDAMQTKPWSEDLLDFLAADLAEHGYNLKQTIALIAGSQAYQSQAAALDAPASPEDYVFTGPLPKRMTAEQFVDAIRGLGGMWPGPDGGAFRLDGRGQGGQLAAVVRAEERAAGRTPLEQLATESLVHAVLEQSVWIWNDAGALSAAPHATAFFRHRSPWEDAAHVLVLCAADHSAKVFLNGQRLVLHNGLDRVVVAEATHRLRPEGNVLAIRVENNGQEPNPAGLLLTVAGISDRGDVLWVSPADETWRAAADAANGWEQPEFDDSPWETAFVVGNAGAEPWKLTTDFNGKKFFLERDWDAHWGERPVRAALAPQDSFQATLGRPNREQVVTTRPSQLTTLEAISLSNGEDMARMLQQAAIRILATHADETPPALADWLYRAALARPPTSEEAAISLELLGSPPTTAGVEDLLWTIVMLPEFQLVR